MDPKQNYLQLNKKNKKKTKKLETATGERKHKPTEGSSSSRRDDDKAKWKDRKHK